MTIEIDSDIRRAATPPGWFYTSEEVYRAAVESAFARSWQIVPPAAAATPPGTAHPFSFLPGAVPEPLVAVRDGGGELSILSNVCTHRAALVVEAPCAVRSLRCRYHGRRFGLDGRFRSMPAFDEAADFPSPDDDLARLPVRRWGPLVFTALDPEVSFDDWIAPIRARFDALPLDRFGHDPAGDVVYPLDAPWALYCDNYLEGFHVPYVHPALARTLDAAAYEIELFPMASLQIGGAAPGEVAFDWPDDHPDAARRVAGYFAYLFPNTMLNFYPWGLSVNVVCPHGSGRTEIAYGRYVLNEELRATGAGADLHRVEMEDEEIVLSAAYGVRARLYRRGRYSPSQERAVHHFHRLLAARVAREGATTVQGDSSERR